MTPRDSWSGETHVDQEIDIRPAIEPRPKRSLAALAIVALGIVVVTAIVVAYFVQVRDGRVVGADVRTTGIHFGADRAGGPPTVFAIISNVGDSAAEAVRVDVEMTLVSDGSKASAVDTGSLPKFGGSKHLGSLAPFTSKLVSPGYYLIPTPEREGIRYTCTGRHTTGTPEAPRRSGGRGVSPCTSSRR